MNGAATPPRLTLRLAVGAVVLIATLAILGAGEIAVRALTDVPFLGNSRNLLIPGRGTRFRNAPDVHAVSFGAQVFTDRDGYRVPYAGYTYPANVRPVLILGDSVAFGPGVPEPWTFAGRLRTRRPELAVYNSAVIGYNAEDYLAALNQELERRVPSAVYLIFCLNDVWDASALRLSHASPPRTWIEGLRAIPGPEWLNAFLREHSKLYLYVKGLATDPSRRYFQPDHERYRDIATIRAALRPVETMAATLKARGIPFNVLITPYEFQLRSSADRDTFLPQQVLLPTLGESGVPTIDTIDWFRADGRRNSADYFLRFDPMHLSAEGHRVLAERLEGLM